MKKLFIYTYTLTILVGTGDLRAQGTPTGTERIYTSNVELFRVGQDSLRIGFDILSSVRLSPNEQLVITPFITDHKENREFLPPLIVNGRRRDKAERRLKAMGKAEPGTDSAFLNIRTESGGQIPPVHYRADVKTCAWMATGGLYLQSEFCGCGRNGQGVSERMVAENIIPSDTRDKSGAGERHRLTPYITFMEPVRETVKKRTEVGTAYITYLPGSAELSLSLADNHEELEKITRDLRLAGTTENGELAVTGISITSYSSPEGSWESNLRLSQKRAKALERYLTGSNRLPASCRLRSEGMGEDWKGLEKLVEEGTGFPGKAEVLRIIREVDVFHGREKQLMDLRGGSAYKYLLAKYFPLLRRSDYRIEYTVPEFGMEYGKELLAHRPGMLSHHELYTIAFSYPAGSKPFNQIFRMARTLFPTDRTSQFNMAAIYMLEGAADKAETLMERFKDDPLAWNNLGVLYMMQDRYEESHAYLNRAIGAGNKEAADNLEILGQLWKKTGSPKERTGDIQ